MAPALPPRRMPPLVRSAGAVALGALGGAVFYALSLPLPFMLGAMFASLVGVMAGLPLRGPEEVRPVVVAVIGVMLGSSFTADLIGQIGGWAVSLAFLLVYMAVVSALVVPYYMRAGGFDPVTAFFAAMPGGIAEMVTIGKAMGGDERAIILAHAARIALTIGMIAVWFRLVLGLDVGGVLDLNRQTGGLSPHDAALLALCGLLGAAVGVRLRLPAPTLIGPMLVSGAVHVAGLTHMAPPGGLVSAAQLMLGTIMGCRFAGTPPARVLRALRLSFGATALMLGASFGFAVALHGLFGQSMAEVLLAYAPGGLSEMSLVALSLRADVAYIVTHHAVRITLLVMLAPVVLAPLARWMKARGR